MSAAAAVVAVITLGVITVDGTTIAAAVVTAVAPNDKSRNGSHLKKKNPQ